MKNYYGLPGSARRDSGAAVDPVQPGDHVYFAHHGGNGRIRISRGTEGRPIIARFFYRAAEG